MKRMLILILTLLAAGFLLLPKLNSELPQVQETQQPTSSETEQPAPAETQPPVPSETAVPETKPTEPPEPVATDPEHSPYYLEDIPVEDVIVYFNEVCLDSEFFDSGDPSNVQKWMIPICFTLEGSYTDEDLAALNSFANWLNELEGFPGISQVSDPTARNLRICFTDPKEMVMLMGENFTGLDGAVTFWYDYNEIYDAIICCRTDIDQQVRNSVIIEELYNGLGPIQDTSLRPDSIIYQEYTQPQWLSPMDELIMQLLYHPDILPGMDAQQCEAVIRRLYY